MGCCKIKGPEESLLDNQKTYDLSAKKINFNPLSDFSYLVKMRKEDGKEGKESMSTSKAEKFIFDDENKSPDHEENIRTVKNAELPFKEKVLEITTIESHKTSYHIRITPNSINDKPHTFGEKFTFGSNEEANHFSFPLEENIARNQFEITYDKYSNAYFIKECSNGTGIFLQIKNKFHIEAELYISFCKTHIRVYRPNSEKSLKIKFVQGVFKDKSYTFFPTEGKIVRIGRKENLEITYKEESISRIQCTFSFEDGKWFISDGNLDKPSTNGSWLMNTKNYELQNGDTFRTGNIIFVAKLS